MDYKVVGGKRILDIHELEELRLDAYENAQIYKERTKISVTRRDFSKEELVLLFYSRLRHFPWKLRSRWSGVFEVTKVMQSRVVEIQSKSTGLFLVNGQRLKHYHSEEELNYYDNLKLDEPPAIDVKKSAAWEETHYFFYYSLNSI